MCWVRQIKKTFQGDSGGPMVCREKHSAVKNGSRRNPKGKIPYLTGIVSFGPDFQCGAEKMPGVYTKVSSFAKVIDKLSQGAFKKQLLNFEDDSFNEDDEHSLLPMKFLE